MYKKKTPSTNKFWAITSTIYKTPPEKKVRIHLITSLTCEVYLLFPALQSIHAILYLFSEHQTTQKVSMTEQAVVKHERRAYLCLRAWQAEKKETIKANQVSKEDTY